MKISSLLLQIKRLTSVSPLALLLLGPLPLFYILVQSNAELNKLKNTEHNINVLHRNFILAKSQKERDNNYINKLKTSSPYYINQNLESLALLKEEKTNAGPENKIPDQRLRFLEGHIRRDKGMQEVEENQESAVFMNEKDLKQTLTLLEGVTIESFEPVDKAPEILIRSIDIKKTPLSNYSKVFEVNMQLIKREAIQ